MFDSSMMRTTHCSQDKQIGIMIKLYINSEYQQNSNINTEDRNKQSLHYEGKSKIENDLSMYKSLGHTSQGTHHITIMKSFS